MIYLQNHHTAPMSSKSFNPTTYTSNQTAETHRNSSKQSQYLEERVPLDKYLQLFEFQTPLPKKQEARTIRLFYNNCNSLEINNAIGEYFHAQRQKKAQKYILNIESLTKIDKLIRYMKQWKVDICCHCNEKIQNLAVKI